MAEVPTPSRSTRARGSGSDSGGVDAAAPKLTLKQRIPLIIAWVQALKPVRVFAGYNAARGPILASGLAFRAIFAVFAALWVAFSIIGLYLQSSPALQESLFEIIGTSVPGLLSVNGSEGAIDPTDLLETGVLSWTGAIALIGLLSTVLGWVAAGRDAVRTIFDLGNEEGNVIVLKLKDLGLAVGFGAALILSAAISVLSTSALSSVLEFLNIDQKSLPAILVTRFIGLLIVLAFDTVVLAAFFRFGAGITIPFRRLAGGSLLGAAGLGVLKALGSALLGGATSNPLLASFAVIIGLLIWFNLICQVILIAASWIATGMKDAGIPFDPKAEKARIEAERKAEEERVAALELERKNRPRGLARLFGRKKRRAEADAAGETAGSTGGRSH